MTTLTLNYTILNKRAIIILIALLSMPLFKACAQQLKSRMMMSVIMEKTIVEKQAGGQIFIQRPSLWRIGGFYQTTIDNRVEGIPNATLWGAMVAAPLVKSQKMNFYLTVRAGMANNMFFVMTPGLLTEIKVFQRWSIDVGMSVRKGYAAVNTGINFKL